jgi:hypothetical protein
MISGTSAEQFAHDWLALLDKLASIDEYLKYLPDGSFEQWSYPEVEIRDVEHLKAFFGKTWGMIQSQTNTIRAISASPISNDRFQLEIDVDWEATLAQGQKLSRPLHYSMTIGPGVSSGDPAGSFPKVYRYAMTRPTAEA